MDRAKSALKDLRPHWDDDIIDKLNYFWTALILVVCMLTIGMKQYVGSPLQVRYWWFECTSPSLRLDQPFSVLGAGRIQEILGRVRGALLLRGKYLFRLVQRKRPRIDRRTKRPGTGLLSMGPHRSLPSSVPVRAATTDLGHAEHAR